MAISYGYLALLGKDIRTDKYIEPMLTNDV